MALDLNKMMGLWGAKVLDLTDKEVKFVKVRVGGEAIILPIEALEKVLSHVQVQTAKNEVVWEGVGQPEELPHEVVREEAIREDRHARVRELIRKSKERDKVIEDECRAAWASIEAELPQDVPRHYLTSAQFDAYKSLDIQLSKHLKLMESGMRVRVTTIVRALAKAEIEIPMPGYAMRLFELLRRFLEEEAWGPRIHEAIIDFVQRHKLSPQLLEVKPAPILENRGMRPQVGRSFVSVCQYVSYFLGGPPTKADQQTKERRLIDVMQDFNGIIRKKDVTEAAGILMKELSIILKSDVSDRVKGEIYEFLKELEMRLRAVMGERFDRALKAG